MDSTAESLKRLNELMQQDDPTLDFQLRLCNQRDELLDIISNSDFKDKDEIKASIKKAYEAAKQCINQYCDGNIKRSIDALGNCFFSEERPLGRTNIKCYNSEDLFLFRLRQNDSSVLYSRDEMFHIPFEKRDLVSNQRFSISGYPCVYAGESIYGSWEELNRPDIDTVNIVIMKNLKFIRIYDLTIPIFSEKDENEIKEKICKSILAWLCSFKTINKCKPFIVEYVIPQIVLSLMLVSLQREEIRKDTGVYEAIAIRGIKYTSTLYNSKIDIFKDKELFTNYVFPVVNSQSSGLCPKLCSYFELSDPTSLLTERIVCNKKAQYMYRREECEGNPYSATEFGMLEETLKNRRFSQIK